MELAMLRILTQELNSLGVRVATRSTEIGIPAFGKIVYPVTSHGRGYRCRWIRENQMMQIFGILAAHLVLVVCIPGPWFTTLRFLFMPAYSQLRGFR